ncbi:MAG: metal-binding protein, partial [Candidatus Bipolaricaulota bacterium]|nr:metal-binding protein [Candidatus Bipolaricaulota bacterium]
MPSHRVHLALELVVLPPCLGAAYGLGLREELLPLTLGYLAGSLFLSPDLDLYHSRPARRWRPLRVLWWPYTRVFRHRGLSHHPLLGPLSRLLYLGLWALGAWALAGLPQLRLPPAALALPFCAGLLLPQVLHVLLDRGWACPGP